MSLVIRWGTVSPSYKTKSTGFVRSLCEGFTYFAIRHHCAISLVKAYCLIWKLVKVCGTDCQRGKIVSRTAVIQKNCLILLTINGPQSYYEIYRQDISTILWHYHSAASVESLQLSSVENRLALDGYKRRENRKRR